MIDGSAARRVDESSVDRLYRDHGHVVLRRARALLREEDAAREIVQEVFMSMLDRPDQWSGRSAVTTWLYAVTTHACLAHLRNHRNRHRLDQERVSPVPALAPADGETWAIVRQLLDRMPDELARVAVHYFVDEMTHQEIADVLGCSRRQVGYLVERVEALVRKQGGRA